MNIITILAFLNKWKKFLIPIVLIGIISFQQIQIKNLKLQNLQLGAKTKEVIKWKTKEVIKTVTEIKYIDRKVFTLEDEKITKLPDGTQITEIHRDIKSDVKSEVVKSGEEKSSSEEKEVVNEKPVLLQNPASNFKVFNLSATYSKDNEILCGAGISVFDLSVSVQFINLTEFGIGFYSVSGMYRF